MKRSALLRKTPLRAKTGLKRTELKRSGPGLARTSALARTPMKRKPRRKRKGDDKRYLAFVRKQPCCVGGARCKKAVAHHAIEMGGKEIAGMASTAGDSQTIAICSRHHREFHLSQGFCAGWSATRRRMFQTDEIERLRQMWADLLDLDVLQEPARKAI